MRSVEIPELAILSADASHQSAGILALAISGDPPTPSSDVALRHRRELTPWSSRPAANNSSHGPAGFQGG
jgi:hypothetical protein